MNGILLINEDICRPDGCAGMINGTTVIWKAELCGLEKRHLMDIPLEMMERGWIEVKGYFC